jgi:hypothetical protein
MLTPMPVLNSMPTLELISMDATINVKGLAHLLIIFMSNDCEPTTTTADVWDVMRMYLAIAPSTT